MRPSLRALRLALVLSLTAGFTLSCGDKQSPIGPSSNDLTVTAITPASGTTLGGTPITITGSHFAAGAIVTIGGAGATSVTVNSDTSITALTPQHASGAADVVVNAGGKSGTLHGGFTFSAPAAQTNQSPTITTVTVKGNGRFEPGGYADIDEQLNVVATVTDPETPVDQLTYQWSADVGAISGDGARVTWTAPHDAPTPHEYNINLTVLENYQDTDSSGLPVTKQNKATFTAVVTLHNSRKEVADMAVQFMNDFSNSSTPKSVVMQNFLDGCLGAVGTANEDADVDKNRRLWTINSYRPSNNPPVTVNFNGSCPFRDRGGVDACAQVDWQWTSTCKKTGQTAIATGTDQVTAVLQGKRWYLCSSDWNGSSQVGPNDSDCDNGIKR